MSEPTQPNLFKSSRFAEFKRNPLQVEVEVRTVYDRWVTIEGKRFDLDDLYETLTAVRDDDVYITDSEIAKVLIGLGVINGAGSNRSSISAKPGENMEEFYTTIQTLYMKEVETSQLPVENAVPGI